MVKTKKVYQLIRVPALVTAFLLLIPFVAMQFSSEVIWTIGDFGIAGAVLFGTGLSYQLITKNHVDSLYKVAVGFTLFVGLLLLWVNLAVGITGAADNPVNLIYFGVIMVGIVGALIARFESKAMVWVMLGTAFAQAFLAFILTLNGVGNSLLELWGVNGFFVSLFLISAFLFYYDSQRRLADSVA